ncbi:uncharacterized protein LOC140702079 [Pogona vitticeps]
MRAEESSPPHTPLFSLQETEDCPVSLATSLKAHPLRLSSPPGGSEGSKRPLPLGDARDQKAGVLLELNQAIVSAEDTHLASFPKAIKEFFQNGFEASCFLLCFTSLECGEGI